jgi:hypothetical protein
MVRCDSRRTEAARPIKATEGREAERQRRHGGWWAGHPPPPPPPPPPRPARPAGGPGAGPGGGGAGGRPPPPPPCRLASACCRPGAAPVGSLRIVREGSGSNCPAPTRRSSCSTRRLRAQEGAGPSRMRPVGLARAWLHVAAAGPSGAMRAVARLESTRCKAAPCPPAHLCRACMPIHSVHAWRWMSNSHGSSLFGRPGVGWGWGERAGDVDECVWRVRRGGEEGGWGQTLASKLPGLVRCTHCQAGLPARVSHLSELTGGEPSGAASRRMAATAAAGSARAAAAAASSCSGQVGSRTTAGISSARSAQLCLRGRKRYSEPGSAAAKGVVGPAGSSPLPDGCLLVLVMPGDRLAAS